MTSTKKTDSNKLKIGDRLSETQYYKIMSIEDTKICVSNERGFTFNIGKNIVEEGMYTSNQYDKEVKMSRTDIVNIFENAKDNIFTINFNKLPTEKSVIEKLSKVQISSLGSNKELKKLSKQLMLGEERTIVGYLIHTEPKMGRTSVVDLEIDPKKYRLRLVDHRTINWLILKNVKYVVK